MTARARPLLWARLGSALSVLPLGVWTVNHLWENLSAFSGEQAWSAAVTHHPHPFAFALTQVFVLGPLVLHTAWGMQRLFTSRPNNLRYATQANLKYLLQRVSAVGVFLFVAAHLWLAFLKPRLIEGHPEPFVEFAREMRFHGPTFWVYVLGTLGVSYHLANGLFSAAWTWGLASSEKGLRRVGVLSVVFGLALLALAWGVLYAVWSAGDGFGPA